MGTGRGEGVSTTHASINITGVTGKVHAVSGPVHIAVLK